MNEEDQRKLDNFTKIHKHLVSMKAVIGDKNMALDILQDTILSLFEVFAPKVYRYRFDLKTVERIANCYINN